MSEETEPPPGRSCPWCSAGVPADATHCPACGAALAQRESIGDLVIQGVTTVDPALQAYAAQPLHIPWPSRSQGMAGSAVVAAAAAGGPLALGAIGGLAAVAAVEYLGAGSAGRAAGGPDADAVGHPSEAALKAVERLERKPAGTTDPA